MSASTASFAREARTMFARVNSHNRDNVHLLETHFVHLRTDLQHLYLKRAIEEKKSLVIIRTMVERMSEASLFDSRFIKGQPSVLELALVTDNIELFNTLFSYFIKSQTLLRDLKNRHQAFFESASNNTHIVRNSNLLLGLVFDVLHGGSACENLIRQLIPNFLIPEEMSVRVIDALLTLAVEFSNTALAECLLERRIPQTPSLLLFSAPHTYSSALLMQAIENQCLPMIELLIQYNICLEADSSGNTPLHMAAWHYHAAIQLLIKAGLNPDTKDANGSTALHILAGENVPESTDAYIRAMQLLCDLTTRDLQDNNNETALHSAARSGLLEGLSILVNAGYNINSCNKKNETPLAIAVSLSSKAKVSYLMSLSPDLSIVPEDLDLQREITCLSNELMYDRNNPVHTSVVKVMVSWFTAMGLDFLDTPLEFPDGSSIRKLVNMSGDSSLKAFVDTIPIPDATSCTLFMG